MDGVQARLEVAIRELLAARADGASICPSEAARHVDQDDWRTLMGPARTAAARLARSGEVEITQGGTVVDAVRVRGPIRIRRASSRQEPEDAGPPPG